MRKVIQVYRKYRRVIRHKGQALVETAILAPLIIFMLIGVFEVGWALRGYLVLANANREIARFAVRPGYVDYESENPDYTPIIAHLFTTLSNQIEFTPTGVVIVSRIYVDTGYPCDPVIIFDCQPDGNGKCTNPMYLNCGKLNPYDNVYKQPCDRFVDKTIQPYTPTIIITPMDLVTYTYMWPVTATEVTRLDYVTERESLINRNLWHNCNLMNRSYQERSQIDDAIYVEMFYQQAQLFGFPLISNPYTDPVPMYAHTVMRRIHSR